MAAWSCFGRAVGVNLLKNNKSALVQKCVNFSQTQILKSGHERTFPFQPSRYSWLKFKDEVHFYVALGVIPCTIIVFLTNVFVGPAQLQEIPDDYVPKYWEYARHPITRFILRYIWHNPQQDYEKQCHFIWEEMEIVKLRRLEEAIRDKMAERHDYQGIYYKPSITAKYLREMRKIGEDTENRMGERVQIDDD